MLSRPKAGPVLCQKLADYRLMLYASTGYLERAGRPQSVDELSDGHRLVSYVPDLIYAPELNYLEDFKPGLTDRKSVVEGKSVSVSVDRGGRRIITKKKE